MGYIDSNGQYRLIGDQHGTLTLAQLKAAVVDPKAEAYRSVTLIDGRRFYYHPSSVLTADDVFVVAPTGGSGRYLLSLGTQNVELPIAFGTADAAILATCPTGFLARVVRCYWHVTADFTGGTNASIGLSSSNATGHTTKGDFQAAALLAALTATIGTSLGTIGADVAAGAFVRAGDTFRFDRIVDAFTAGAGFAGVILDVIANPGA